MERVKAPQREFLVSNLLLGINIAVYIWMVLHRVSPNSPSSEQVIVWGGNYGPLTLSTQPWRLFTCLFEHIGYVHLIANMWALFVLGRLAESLFGRWSYLWTYLLSGIAGSVASLLWNPLGISAGASGAIFGIAGALIAAFFVGKLPIPKHSQRTVLATLIFWAGFDLLYGIWKQGVDNAAHIGGLITGLALGLLLGHHLSATPQGRAFRERLFTVAALVIVLFTAFVWYRDRDVAGIERAQLLIKNGAIDEGLRQLQPVAKRLPKDPTIPLLMGEAYARKGDAANAEQAYRRVTQLAPENVAGWELLAQTLTAEQKLPEAAAAWIEVAKRSKDKNALAWFNAGQVYARMDKPGEAIKAYQTALAQAPNLPDAWAALGYTQLRENQPAQAIPSLEKAVRLRPADPDYHQLLGYAYQAVGKNNEAQQQFFEAGKLRAALQQRVRQLMQQRQPAAQGAAPARK